jgi:hypothetical protein
VPRALLPYLSGMAPTPATRPENIEALSRTALMLHARILGLVGRSAMTRTDLADAVASARAEMDDDLSRATRCFAPRAAVRRAQKVAHSKPSRPDLVYARFAGPDYGYVPCVDCGLKLHHRADNPLGFETMTVDTSGGFAVPVCRADGLRRASRPAVLSQASVRSRGWQNAIRSTTPRTTSKLRSARVSGPGSWGGMAAIWALNGSLEQTRSWKDSWRLRMSRRSVIGTSRSPAGQSTRPPSSR